MSEYYIDRITTGLPATVNYQGKKYPLRITKVVPEVKDRMFDVDLVFTGEMPDNVRVGKSFRVQIELGQPEQAIVIFSIFANLSAPYLVRVKISTDSIDLSFSK